MIKISEEKTWMEDDNENEIGLLDHPLIREGVVNFSHTEVDPAFAGQGIAGQLTKATAEYLRSHGLKAELSCSYSIKWFAKHPEYSDVLVDPDAETKKAKELAGPACGIKR